MSKFVKAVSITEQFEGDTVVFVATPMSYASAANLREVASGFTEEDSGKAYEVSMAALRAEFANALQSVTGLKDANGDAIDKSILLVSAYFNVLVQKVSVEWMKQAVPTGNA